MEVALPLIIQGGMGIGVSNWNLARAVSLRGHLGVVSGTCIDTVFVRRLQDGDIRGDLRRAIEQFPISMVGAEALRKYFSANGRPEGVPYKLLPMWRQTVSKARAQLTMLASFVEVYLAKEGHNGLVGMNLLTKVQLPNLATLYGAMLAGVDYVLMGAGIPKDIPGVLDAFATGSSAAMRFDVEGLERGRIEELRFEPRDHFDGDPPQLKRPAFLPIVAAHSLATMLARKANGRVDGFVVEAPIAGGHNAPPRGKLEIDAEGEPVYGARDVVDLEEMRRLGKPFWLAGGTGSPESIRDAGAAGAAGVQIGTLFAFAEESGLTPELKRAVLAKARTGDIAITTDLRASPTGFPFKVVQLDGTNSSEPEYARRERKCDLGYLRSAYQRADGKIGFRCAAEPQSDWVNKGGVLEDTEGRKCLCNGLTANIGLAQIRADGIEKAILTSGNDVASLQRFASEDGSAYTVDQVIDYLMSAPEAPEHVPESRLSPSDICVA
jgi:NAD(P)H-dependent flavin oxidoreductase YrpB (nitropropane dioxygenase family)